MLAVHRTLWTEIGRAEKFGNYKSTQTRRVRNNKLKGHRPARLWNACHRVRVTLNWSMPGSPQNALNAYFRETCFYVGVAFSPVHLVCLFVSWFVFVFPGVLPKRRVGTCSRNAAGLVFCVCVSMYACLVVTPRLWLSSFVCPFDTAFGRRVPPAGL